MKTKNSLLLAILTAIAVVSAEAKPMDTTNTLSFSGATWNDGGTLDGFFTIIYDPTGLPIDLLSADITTGDSTPGFYGGATFAGFEYIFDIAGKANTAGPGTAGFIDATQNGGSSANELVLTSLDGPYRAFYLDWQGSTTMSLYSGNADGQYTSENYSGDPTLRFINSSGGSVEPVPEPTTLALAGLGGLGLLLFRRRK